MQNILTGMILMAGGSYLIFYTVWWWVGIILFWLGLGIVGVELVEKKRPPFCIVEENLAVRWIKFGYVMKRDGRFQNCPVCGGIIALQEESTGWMCPNVHNPGCEACKTIFRPRKKALIFRGFEYVSRG